MPERVTRRRSASGLTGISIERRRAFRWLLVPAAQWALPAAWASASQIASARLWPAEDYTRVIFEAATPVEHQLVVLRNPDRLVLDLARIERSRELDELPARVQASDPYIGAIRIGQAADGFLRVVLDLKTDVRPQVFALKPVAEFGHRLVIDLYPLIAIDPLMALLARERDAPEPAPAARTPPQAQASRREQTASQREQPASRRVQPVRRVTVAIDPGHGGEDPGAVGRRGTYEKNVVLAIAHKLKRALGPWNIAIGFGFILVGFGAATQWR